MTSRMNGVALSAVGSVAVALACSAASAQPLVPTVANVPYGDGHAKQVLDVYLPPGGAGGRPLVIWIHGGGWQNGDKAPALKAPPLVGLGFAVASINYRLSGDAPFPAQIHDCKAAVRFLRGSAAAYGIDPVRIGVWGSSAGGHLVALVGTSGDVAGIEGTVGGFDGVSSRVQAVADFFGPADFLAITDPEHLACDSPESRMLGVCLGEVAANQTNPEFADEVSLVNSASPAWHVSADDPPFHIAHGSADPVVQVEQSVILAADLSAAGVETTLRIIPGAGHGLPAWEDIYTRRFLCRTLGVALCEGDFDANGRVDSTDIFTFLEAWFRELDGCLGECLADQDASGEVDVDDIFALLDDWFADGPGTTCP